MSLGLLVFLFVGPRIDAVTITNRPLIESETKLLELHDGPALKSAAKAAGFDVVEKVTTFYLVDHKLLEPNSKAFVDLLGAVDPKHAEIRMSNLDAKGQANFRKSILQSPVLSSGWQPQTSSPDFGIALVPTVAIEFERDGKKGTVMIEPHELHPVEVKAPGTVTPSSEKQKTASDDALPIVVTCHWSKGLRWQTEHSATALQILNQQVTDRWSGPDAAAQKLLDQLFQDHADVFGDFRAGDRPSIDSMNPALKNSFMDRAAESYAKYGFSSRDEARAFFSGVNITGSRSFVNGAFSFPAPNGQPNGVIFPVYNGNRN